MPSDKNRNNGRDINQIMDEVCETDLTSAGLARVHMVIEQGQYPDMEDIKTMFEDLARLRYRYTLAHMSHQVAQLVMREKDTIPSIIGDLRHAGKTLVWVINEFKNMLKNSQDDDE